MLIGAIEIRDIGFELRSAGIDHLVNRIDAFLLSIAIDIEFGFAIDFA